MPDQWADLSQFLANRVRSYVTNKNRNMCGRAAQTIHAAQIAAKDFCSSSYQPDSSTLSTTSKSIPIVDNFNLSPGMDCAVMSVNESGHIKVDKKKWGLISKRGTSKKPLYANENDIMKLCFSSLCFNARSDTLYSKPTFSNLAHRGRTCIIALDGYFEWKSQIRSKQPFFVYRKHQGDYEEKMQYHERQPLLIAGLWTRVATGLAEAPVLDSFAMLTTEASKQIEWLHHRMPLCVWDIDLAKRWLEQPSETLKKELDDAARSYGDVFAWHKVAPEMSKLTFRSKNAIREMKDTTRSVKHFFGEKRTFSEEDREENITGNSSVKKDGEVQSSSFTKRNNAIDERLESKLAITTAGSMMEESSSTGTKGGKRKSTFSAKSSPSKRKLKSDKTQRGTSTTSNYNRKQLSINVFFQKK